MFRIKVDRRPDLVRYTLEGAVCGEDAQRVRLAEEPIDPGAVVVIELSQVSDLDDMGFGAIVALVRRARERDGHVVMVTSEGPVRRRLVDSGVERLAVSAEREPASLLTRGELLPV